MTLLLKSRENPTNGQWKQRSMVFIPDSYMAFEMKNLAVLGQLYSNLVFVCLQSKLLLYKTNVRFALLELGLIYLHMVHVSLGD